MTLPPPPSYPRKTAGLEEIGLYNLLNRVARGGANIDELLLHNLRRQGYVESESQTLTVVGRDKLRALATLLGWFYPETPSNDGV